MERMIRNAAKALIIKEDKMLPCMVIQCKLDTTGSISNL